MRAILAGGGTGGHVIPALAIAQELQRRHQAEVLFIGTARGLENRLVPAAGFPLQLVKVGALNRVSLATRLRTALDLAIWLEVSEQTVRDRISGRLQCGECGFTTSASSAKFAERPVCPYCDGPLVRRNDDDVSVLQTRLQEFHAKTEPLASFYGKMSILHRIDGNRDRETVFRDISRLIETKVPA